MITEIMETIMEMKTLEIMVMMQMMLLGRQKMLLEMILVLGLITCLKEQMTI